MAMDQSAFDEIVEEAKGNPYQQDSIGLIFNNIGLIKFRSQLVMPSDGSIPLYTLPLNSNNIQSILRNLSRLFPYLKGILLKLTSAQTRRKLIAVINSMILEFIDRPEMDSSINIIHELTANGEKANLENIIFRRKLASEPSEMVKVIRSEKPMLLGLCDQENKWVKISWKFTHKIFKIEVKNNTAIDSTGVSSIKSKVNTQLNSLADGFIEEVDEKIGAGLGLFFVNFFKDEMKDKFDFETIFRVYENDFNETVASLTVIFEKS
jgi:hypothetical protein